jgi:hypothetical protein
MSHPRELGTAAQHVRSLRDGSAAATATLCTLEIMRWGRLTQMQPRPNLSQLDEQ